MPTLPLSALGVPEDARTAAWRYVAELLTTDRPLGRLGIDWRLPDSTAYDDDPRADGITVKITPAFGPVSEPVAIVGGRKLCEAPVTLTLETAVPGQLADNSGDLWGLIESAILCRGQQPATIAERWHYLRRNRITDLAVLAPATAGPDEVGTGQIRLSLYLEF